VALPLASPVILAAVNGTAYGLVHLRNRQLALVTIVAGIVWSYVYLRDRQLLPIAISHAVLGSTFYYFVGTRDLFTELVALIGHAP
jgi:membrane protease YdiL (CAAX protease family)